MTNRRELLSPFAAVVAGAERAAADECKCVRPGAGPHADYLPNVLVTTHEGRRALFYNDLLRRRTVLINFLALRDKAAPQVIERLVAVQRLLGGRAGRAVFIYSLTLDPQHDTPRLLRAFAERHGVGPGWLFVTGQPEIMQGLRHRLFLHEGAPVHAAHHPAEHAAPVYDCSAGLLRYGNETVGLWGAVPIKTDPAQIVARLDWISARPQPSGTPKRRGPVIRA